MSLIVSPPAVENKFLVLILKSTFDSGPAFLLILSPSVKPLLVLPSTFTSTSIILSFESLGGVDPPEDVIKVPQLPDEDAPLESVAVSKILKLPAFG